MLNAVGEEFEWVEGQALANVVGTRHHHAAVFTPCTVLVNPAALCRGLGETLPDIVDVCAAGQAAASIAHGRAGLPC